jgi:hypothetical protein
VQTSKHFVKLSVAFIVTLGIAAMLQADTEPQIKPVAVQEPVVPRPERLHYVVWIADCGAFLGMLLTDSDGPPLWLFGKQHLTFEEQLRATSAIEAGRELYADTGRAGCIGT